MVRRVDVAPRRVNPTGTLDMAADTTDTRFHSAQIAYPQHTDHDHDRMPRTQTRVTISEQPIPARAEGDFGGFPGPQDLLSRLLRRAFPGFYRGIRRTLTVPRTRTLVPHDSTHVNHVNGPSTQVSYFSFKATVGRNSVFLNLTEEQMEELGGVEYRALHNLMWIIPLYYFGLLTVAVVIIAPYMYIPRWSQIFLPPQQHRKISPMWFSIFQVVGAWANTGMSLVDQNLFPFQTAYPMIFVLIFLVMAGNTAFPIFFRFTIWLLRKAFAKNTPTAESLLFLLHHPRRCTINLFPARQTWLLLAIVTTFTITTMVGDILLNLGNPVTDAIPVGIRILDAFLQSAATRSAGFQPFPLSSQFPAALVLYIITMYIAIYPIALSVRSTNVYEEQSLGVYPSETLDTTYKPDTQENRIAIWGKYLMRHTRRQLSFDMWWLALSLWVISIIERKGLTNPNNISWLNLFALIFEVVSAYGTVGLSLGVPNQNYSLSGALHPLSKLVICVVMLRGRHRGLPVALDRAVMLPRRFPMQTEQVNDSGERPPSPRPSVADGNPPEDIGSDTTSSEEQHTEKHASPDLQVDSSGPSSAGSHVEPAAMTKEGSDLKV
ncbi:low affinity potassium transporter [Steccherinum ochraceum]|uniref:Low affinity potassium transporter n=1 Tax=Steccherinum ochraceum TaxID=92696 RepID=A0A4R0R0Z7_9APHY|nr:low affinity potassium transporter [Steccherinum ochraceum]